MQTWQQLYSPLGSLGLSALAAVIPIVFFFLALAVFRLKGHVAGSITLCFVRGVRVRCLVSRCRTAAPGTTDPR